MNPRKPSRAERILGIAQAVCAALALPSLPLAQSPPEGPISVEELVRRADPLLDDWETEAAQTPAARQLKALAELLGRTRWAAGDLADIVAEGALATALRPSGLKPQRIGGGIELSGVDRPAARKPSNPVASALESLTAPFRGGSMRRFEFKIVGVSPAAGGPPATTVRYEAAGRSPEGVLQQTARWQVTWTRHGEASVPMIASIRLESFEELTAPRLSFEDLTASVIPGGGGPLLAGADFRYGRLDAIGEPNLMGHQGIAIGDVNGDGLEDVYVARGTGLPNMLLVQNADGTVRDVADEAGVAWLDDTKGALFADTDNDGDQDLLTAIGPTIVLCKNDGKGKFERFVGMRAATSAAVYSISVADYDLDGDLDIFGARYVKNRYGVSVPMPFHDANNGPTNHLLRNDGEDRFVDVTAQSGLDVNNDRFSLVGAWGDYDADGDPDLYVANDFGRNNLYRNDGGKFVDVAAEAGVEDQAAGMGVSWADYDLDGDVDLYVTNMYSAAGNRVTYQPRFEREVGGGQRRQIRRYSQGNSLFANQGDGTFTEVGEAAGVRMGRWGWGAKFVDLNNDRHPDLVVPNGFLSGPVEDDL